MLHSAQYRNAADWGGKRVIVIGASTTGCDVALDAAKAGAASVALVQRGEIRLYPQEHIGQMLNTIFPESMPLEFSDILSTEDPMKLGGILASGFLAQCDSKLEWVDLLYCIKQDTDVEASPSYYEDVRKAGLRIKTVGSPVEVRACSCIRRSRLTCATERSNYCVTAEDTTLM